MRPVSLPHGVCGKSACVCDWRTTRLHAHGLLGGIRVVLLVVLLLLRLRLRRIGLCITGLLVVVVSLRGPGRGGRRVHGLGLFVRRRYRWRLHDMSMTRGCRCIRDEL
jgi:hypothetical protein